MGKGAFVGGGSDEEVVSKLKATFEEVQGAFERQQRVLSFEEYIAVFRAHPERHSRDAASYLCDMVQYYGSEPVERPLGKAQRYKVFDQAFLPDKEAESHALIGQEAVQDAIIRSLNNFKREGLANRVLLLHGPNGSSKSTIASCLMAGLEDYSTKDEGALYRFHWVFPKKATMRGAIGFSGGKEPAKVSGGSYAHLNDDQIETKLVVEVRDHPLFLIPVQTRQKLLLDLAPPGLEISSWLSQGSLCQKNQQIFSALLTSYGGSLAEVLRHVRVERYFISRRYRIGAVTLGPELSVDAHERQVTADQNLGALPASLQGLSLYDVSGELVDASGGLLELSDLLKRPIDAYKYLQTTVETGHVSVGSQSLLVNCVMLASGNELHLTAFRDHPEYESFRGRFQLIAVPYLCDYRLEQEIYDRQIAKRISAHVAPHATKVAARFAVLTRLLKPVEEHYESTSRSVVSQITAWDKMRAYAGELREFELEGRKVPMKQLTLEMGKEWVASHVYEGIFGVSPRVMRTVLLEAAQDQNFSYLSPFAVLDEIDRLCEKEQDYAFLRQEPRPGGFHDHAMFRQKLREDLLDTLEDEFRVASGLVEDTSYEELLTKYVTHVSAWVKSERLKDPVTGGMQPADAGLMDYVEGLLSPSDRGEEARRALLSRIAAWAIDHPKQKVTQSSIFSDKLAALRAAVFRERRSLLGDFCRRFVEQLQEGGALDKQVTLALSTLEVRFGYSQRAACDAAARLVTERFRDMPAK